MNMDHRYAIRDHHNGYSIQPWRYTLGRVVVNQHSAHLRDSYSSSIHPLLNDCVPDLFQNDIYHDQDRLQVDQDSDSDSGYAGSIASSTQSLSSSVYNGLSIHDRSYPRQQDGAHAWNPVDQDHQEALNTCHEAFTRLQNGKLCLANIDFTYKKVLDVGTGTGIWALDFADENTTSEVIGVDISWNLPTSVPINLKFEVDDITKEWTYPPGTFDYIHARWLSGSILNWVTFYTEVFRATKPGGSFEHLEISHMFRNDTSRFKKDSALTQWNKAYAEAGRKSGRSFSVVQDNIQEQMMREVGFVDIQVICTKMPVRLRPRQNERKPTKTLGDAILMDTEGFITFTWSSVMEWSREQIQVYADCLRRELEDAEDDIWFPSKTVIGKKPLTVMK